MKANRHDKPHHRVQQGNRRLHGSLAHREPAGTAAGRDPGPSFAGLVKDALADATAAAKGSEAATTAAMTTGGDMSNVVTAVAEAEAALQTVVAVRDRVIEAYKDIMRMPI